jgi:transcriptional regulator with XRE-family HTH domain
LSDQTELSSRIAEVLGSADYNAEDLILSLTGEFLERMELIGTTRTELASRLGVKPPRVTRILQGNDNFTLRTVSRIADALGCRLVVTLEPLDAPTPTSDPSKVPTGRRAIAVPAGRGKRRTAAVSTSR